MTTTSTSISGLIDIGTTQLYYEVRGRGPTLMLITGGTGDADEWCEVAPELAEDFMVLTYDRRGFSRSSRPAGWNRTSVTEHADDAAALLKCLDLTPATVVGHSSGASIACDLVARHPSVVRSAVIYEPPAFTSFLPDCAAMRSSGVPLTVVVGAQSRDTWFDAAATWLVAGTAADRAELPGGHAGFDTHPREFIDLVRRRGRDAQEHAALDRVRPG